MADWFSRFRGESSDSSESPQSPQDDDDDTLTNPPLEQQLLRLQQESLEALALFAERVEGVEKILSRLAKEQFKANSLTEDALAAVKSTLLPMPAERASQMKPPATNTRLLEALMPILDGIEAGLTSGQTQASVIGDQRARDILLGWLEGQRLLRDRLLALLDKENVRPIESVGQPFDPYHHVAVETIFDPSRPTGTIVEERRRGYETDQRVLRFAEVVVTSQRQP